MTRGLLPFVAAMTFMSISAAYVSMRQHTSAYSAYAGCCPFFAAIAFMRISEGSLLAAVSVPIEGHMRQVLLKRQYLQFRWPYPCSRVDAASASLPTALRTGSVPVFERESARVCVCVRERESERDSASLPKLSMHAQAHTGVGRGNQTHTPGYCQCFVATKHSSAQGCTHTLTHTTWMDAWNSMRNHIE